jgi:hypothetical protein
VPCTTYALNKGLSHALIDAPVFQGMISRASGESSSFLYFSLLNIDLIVWVVKGEVRAKVVVALVVGDHHPSCDIRSSKLTEKVRRAEQFVANKAHSCRYSTSFRLVTGCSIVHAEGMYVQLSIESHCTAPAATLENFVVYTRYL